MTCVKYFHKEDKLAAGGSDIIRDKVLKTKDVQDFGNTNITLIAAWWSGDQGWSMLCMECAFQTHDDMADNRHHASTYFVPSFKTGEYFKR